MPTAAEIAAAIEAVAPLSLQESWDNSGWQLLLPQPLGCSGALLCVDVTADTVREAATRELNLIVSHHPLIFSPLKSITPDTAPVLLQAMYKGISIYSCHTPLDIAPEGLSYALARDLDLDDIEPLCPRPGLPGAGLGVIGTLRHLTIDRFIDRIRAEYDQDNLRISSCSTPPRRPPYRVAICSGSGGSLLDDVIAAGADIYITSDLSHHRFLDYGTRLLLIDTGHWESEKRACVLLQDMIREKFPNFAACISSAERNPIKYI